MYSIFEITDKFTSNIFISPCLNSEARFLMCQNATASNFNFFASKRIVQGTLTLTCVNCGYHKASINDCFARIVIHQLAYSFIILSFKSKYFNIYSFFILFLSLTFSEFSVSEGVIVFFLYPVATIKGAMEATTHTVIKYLTLQ